jgi:hypothetical protein
MNDHLRVGNVGQGIHRHLALRPDAGQHQQKRSSEDEEAIAGASIDPAGDHLHASLRGHGAHCGRQNIAAAKGSARS